MRKHFWITILIILICCVTILVGCDTAYHPILPTAEEVAEISVTKVDELPRNFIKGVDVSSVVSLEKAGAVFFNKKGQKQDLFKILADAGVNYIRTRVWNNPFDINGRGYGGGNCDVTNAMTVSQRASKYNLKLCVDFHYSDFWADPQNQKAPKSWKNYTLTQKEKAIYQFTKNALFNIARSGAEIGMVQIGNEINNGLCGETNEQNVISLLKQCASAVRDFSRQNSAKIKIALHFTDIHNEGLVDYKAKLLQDNQLDYDVFGVSYYSYWHGSFDNLTKTLQKVRTTYGKDTIVLETAYPYTVKDNDGHPNNVGENEILEKYPASVQGQADNLRDVICATSKAGGLGVFYWEPAWIPVGKDLAERKYLWEQFGCGWASSFSVEYDATNAGVWYGGSSWDNQTLFDATGKQLASLDVFKYVNFGARKV